MKFFEKVKTAREN